MKILFSIFLIFFIHYCYGWWLPSPGTTWNIQLNGVINKYLDVQMFDVDLFDTPESIINDLHKQGSYVICYFSAGSYEDWRSDIDQFPSSAVGNPLDGWEGEYWLDIRNSQIRSIMQSRMDLAISKNCDGIDPDNVNAYTNNNGFNLTYSNQIDYNTFLATESHNRNLSIGLKNDLEQISDLVSLFDFEINEQCYQYSECDLLLPFTNANKAVFGIEYKGDPSILCPYFNSRCFSYVFKSLDLKEEIGFHCLECFPSTCIDNDYDEYYCHSNAFSSIHVSIITILVLIFFHILG